MRTVRPGLLVRPRDFGTKQNTGNYLSHRTTPSAPHAAAAAMARQSRRSSQAHTPSSKQMTIDTPSAFLSFVCCSQRCGKVTDFSRKSIKAIHLVSSTIFIPIHIESPLYLEPLTKVTIANKVKNDGIQQYNTVERSK